MALFFSIYALPKPAENSGLSIGEHWPDYLTQEVFFIVWLAFGQASSAGPAC
jgi:hypothetical protein